MWCHLLNFRPERPGTAPGTAPVYQCTKHFVWANSVVPKFFGTYQKNSWYTGYFNKYGVRSLRAPLRDDAHENERIARENEKNEARGEGGGRDRGLDEVKRLQIGAFCLHHACSPRLTRRGDASSGYRTHAQSLGFRV